MLWGFSLQSHGQSLLPIYFLLDPVFPASILTKQKRFSATFPNATTIVRRLSCRHAHGAAPRPLVLAPQPSITLYVLYFILPFPT